MSYIIRGYLMVFTDRKLRAYAVRPMWIGALLFLAVMIGGYYLVVPPLANWIGNWGVPEFLRGTASLLLYATVWIVFSGAVFTTIVGSVSGLLWDRLSMEVEDRVIGVAENRSPNAAIVIGDSILRIAFAAILSILALLLSCVTAGISGIVAAGIIGLFDYSASGYIRRGILFGRQRRHVLKHKNWLGFAIPAGIISTIPILNIVSLPALVAAGTLFCLDEQGRL